LLKRFSRLSVAMIAKGSNTIEESARVGSKCEHK